MTAPLPELQAPETASEARLQQNAPIYLRGMENAPSPSLQRLQRGFSPVVIGVHGIYSQGGRSTDLILRELERRGIRTLEFDWGPMPLFLSRAYLDATAARLKALLDFFAVDHPVYVVAHSFGPKILLRALRRGAKIRDAWLFNPAIPPRSDFPAGSYNRITVIANPRDQVVRLAQRLLPWMGLGDMGRRGYLGASPRVHTVFETLDDAFTGQHGQSFYSEQLLAWCGEIANTLPDHARAHTAETSTP